MARLNLSERMLKCCVTKEEAAMEAKKETAKTDEGIFQGTARAR